MPLRPPAGFIRPGFDPLKNPDAPTAVEATGGDESASVAFTPPANVGGSAISEYYAVSNPDRVTVSGATSPINVTGLTNGTPYTFQVWALNTYGPGPFSAASGSVTPAAPQAFFGGGETNNTIDYVVITTTGNALDFGDLVQNNGVSACASSVRGVWAGGRVNAAASTNVLQYITFSTTGNATDFGDLVVIIRDSAACSSATRGVFGGGTDENFNLSNVIQYITIATLGNSQDFGDLTLARELLGSCSSPTRGIWGGGASGATRYNNIDYVTISSVGNAVDFGDLTQGRGNLAACSSPTRGLFGGGYTGGNAGVNTIDFITIASTGNATDFGDLFVKPISVMSASSNLRGLFGGGNINESGDTTLTNIIAYVTIASTGNATDFGDLTVARERGAACSNSHGGLQ